MNELSQHMKYFHLVTLAKTAYHFAYAPYSKFYVGTALRTKNNKIFLGCNIENAAYSETICAERVAIAKAVSIGIKNFTEIAIFTNTYYNIWPCGSCRQVLSEFSPNIIIISSKKDNTIKIQTLKNLLPNNFQKKHLKKIRI